MLRVWNLGQVGPQDVPVIYSFCSPVGCLQGYENKGPHRASLFRIKKDGQGSESKTWNDEKKHSKQGKQIQKNDQKQIKQIIRHVMLILGWLLSCFVHFCSFLCLRTYICSVCGVYDFIIPGAYGSYGTDMTCPVVQGLVSKRCLVFYCFQVAVPTRICKDKCLPNVSTDLRRILCIYI